MTARVPGKRGLQPQREGAARFPLRWLHEYAPGGALPAPSYPVDVTGGIEDFGMLGNGPDPTCTTHPDGVGDCTYAGRQHVKMAKAAAAGITETWETSNALVAEYLAYDHGQDEGAVIADLLLAWYRAGKILGFAPVDHSSPAQVDAAMAAFHGAYCGGELTGDADELFSEGRDWGTGSLKPDPRDGHCFVKMQADGRKRDVYCTWGALQGATLAWTKACVSEVWVIITSEDEAAKIDMAALVADIEALHGQQDVPAPAPAPVAQTPAQVLWQTAGPWCEGDHPRTDLAKLKAALETFAAAEGLS